MAQQDELDEGLEVPAAAAHPQIDQRWVNVDVDNIVVGQRTRNRPDYNILA